MNERLGVQAVPTEKTTEGFNHPLWYSEHWKKWNGKLDAQGMPHHLYFTDDSEIKEGDKNILHIPSGEVGECIKRSPNSITCKFPNSGEVRCVHYNCRKIVATTNPELWYDFSGFSGGGNPRPTGITKIPQSFFQYFVERQGVWEVDVEMEKKYWIGGAADCGDDDLDDGSFHYEVIKLNSQGEVIWHPVEQKMYTREEFKNALWEARHFYDMFKNTPYNQVRPQFKEWFNQKYPE